MFRGSIDNFPRYVRYTLYGNPSVQRPELRLLKVYEFQSEEFEHYLNIDVLC